MGHVVTAPLVIVKDAEGAQQYHYKDAVLPSYVKAADLKRLVEDGLVEKVAETAAAPAASEQPAGNASLEAWSDFAKSKGATEGDLEGKTRDQLREQYSS